MSKNSRVRRRAMGRVSQKVAANRWNFALANVRSRHASQRSRSDRGASGCTDWSATRRLLWLSRGLSRELLWPQALRFGQNERTQIARARTIRDCLDRAADQRFK